MQSFPFRFETDQCHQFHQFGRPIESGGHDEQIFCISREQSKRVGIRSQVGKNDRNEDIKTDGP